MSTTASFNPVVFAKNIQNREFNICCTSGKIWKRGKNM